MKVRHPTFPDVVQDVTDVGSWLEQGWLEVDAGQPADPPQITPSGPTPVAKPKRSRVRRNNPEVKEASHGE